MKFVKTNMLLLSIITTSTLLSHAAFSQVTVSAVPGSIFCLSGYTPIPSTGPGLCITALQSAQRYDEAQRLCRDKRGRVATYEDLFYLFRNTASDVSYNPYGRWIGNLVQDDGVLCGNADINYDDDPEIWNFEGTCNKTDNRQYWCTHDPK